MIKEDRARQVQVILDFWGGFYHEPGRLRGGGSTKTMIRVVCEG
jgi:hypothetical protein